jgi:hypothetical protein
MKEIILSSDYSTIVDDEDYEFLKKFKWYLNKGKITFYARAKINGKMVRMHRLILKANSTQIIDHKDRNGLNNQKDNLRFYTLSQNAMNRKGLRVKKMQQ